MRTSKLCLIVISAFLLASCVTGCSDPDKNAGAGNPGDPLTPPLVTTVTPPDASTLVCPNTAVITATFSKAMNAGTINTTTFKLMAPPNSSSVAGMVAYNSATFVATFTPTGVLAPNTPYTATVTTGAQDPYGNPMAANKVWTFTTSIVCPPPVGAFVLGAACSFGMLGATPSITNIGPTVITGDIGISPGGSIVGFPPGVITGTQHAGDVVAATAEADLITAYNNAAAAPGGAVLAANIGGLTLAPGVYKTTSAQPSLGITGDLTLAGNGIYIFQIVSSLTTAAGSPSVPASRVILTGGAVAHDVFWQVGSSATLGTYSTFAGTVMANSSITLGTGAVLNGRALAEHGAVTMDTNMVNVPSCP